MRESAFSVSVLLQDAPGGGEERAALWTLEEEFLISGLGLRSHIRLPSWLFESLRVSLSRSVNSSFENARGFG